MFLHQQLARLNNQLRKNLEKKTSKFIPAYCIPTKEVIKYFDLDIKFLKSTSYFDKAINDGLPK